MMNQEEINELCQKLHYEFWDDFHNFNNDLAKDMALSLINKPDNVKMMVLADVITRLLVHRLAITFAPFNECDTQNWIGHVNETLKDLVKFEQDRFERIRKQQK